MKIDANNYCGSALCLHPVKAMQTYLRYINRYIFEISNVVPDGIYGKETQNAVSSFQEYFGLPKTGIIDYATWEMIIFVYQQLRESNKAQA